MQTDTPYVFLSHNGRDKPRIEKFIAQLLADGITVLIDRTELFDKFDAYVARRQLRSIEGGAYFSKAINAAILDDKCACVIGFLSIASMDPENPQVGIWPRTEMQAATETTPPKLVLVEIDAGMRDRLPQVDAGWRVLCETGDSSLRPERFAFDYGKIGSAVEAISGGRISVGTAAAAQRLKEQQAQLAKILSGQPGRVRLIKCDEDDRPFACRLVPRPNGTYFWLTEAPVAVVDSAEAAQDVAGGIGGFRLPSADEMRLALAPLGPDYIGENPFGFTTPYSEIGWDIKDGVPTKTAGSAGGHFALHLVYIS